MRSPARVDGYAPIRDYAVIGNKRTAALVALDGSIDWMCLPAFDSGTVFGALLDAGSGGRYVLTPESPYYAERRYVEHSNVLETTYSTADGTVRVTEALNLQEIGPLPWNELVRRVEGVAGRVSMRWSVAPRFEWGAVGGALEWRHGVPVIVAGSHALALQSFDAGEPEGTAGPGGAHVSGSFAIREGRSALLPLSCFYDEPYLVSGRQAFESRLAQTVDFWRRWAAIVGYEGPRREAFVRSALVLELLVYAPTGAMVAAPTSSLPEAIGGSRNWDYRYSWLRDTAYTLEAMLRIGYRDQVHSSLAWVLQTIKRTHPRVGVFYHLNGEPPGETVELDLEGYRMSRPVRYGNGAAGATAGQLGRRRSVRRRWNDANSRLISASPAGPRMPRPLEAAGTRACQADDEVRAKGRVPAGHRRRASERTPTMDTGGKSAQAAPRPTGVGRTDEPAAQGLPPRAGPVASLRGGSERDLTDELGGNGSTSGGLERARRPVPPAGDPQLRGPLDATPAGRGPLCSTGSSTR